MRQIAVIADELLARRFSDHLLVSGIDNSLEQGDGGLSLWVHDEADLERARLELEQFHVDPDHERYQAVSTEADGLRRQRERDDLRRSRNIIKPRKQWTLDLRGRLIGARGAKIGRFTLTLIVISVGVAVVTRLGESRGPALNALLTAPVSFEGNLVTWNGLDAIAHGQLWRLITPIFIHWSIFHILFNMWWLKDLGSLIEAKKGVRLLVILVLVSAVASNLAQYFWTGPLGGGMSGVVYALFGYMWLKGRLQPGERLSVTRSTVILFIAWLFFCMTGWIGPIGNAAHVVGLLTGMAFAYAAWLRQRHFN